MLPTFRIVCGLAVACLAGCSEDQAPLVGSAPVAVIAAAPATTTAAAVTADLDLPQLAGRLLADKPDDADRTVALARVDATVAAVLAAAAAGSPAQQGRAPGTVLALGTAALPSLTTALSHRDPVQRRLASLCLLQFGDALRTAAAADQVRAALATARQDEDLAVRAAAEHAWRFATGDTSALDASRAAHEAAERRAR